MPTIKKLIATWRESCRFHDWANDIGDTGPFPKGLFFVETSIKKDAQALIRLFKQFGLSADNYLLQKEELSGQILYSIW